MTDVVLPAFEMDCRDWIVVRPEAGETEDESGAPVLAVLSTSIIEDDIHEATGSITVGLLDPTDELDDFDTRPLRPGGDVREMLDAEPEPGTRRYLVPAPDRGQAADQRLALLAEFSVPPHAEAELDRRVEALMGSFRWQAA